MAANRGAGTGKPGDAAAAGILGMFVVVAVLVNWDSMVASRSWTDTIRSIVADGGTPAGIGTAGGRLAPVALTGAAAMVGGVAGTGALTGKPDARTARGGAGAVAIGGNGAEMTGGD